MLFSPPSQIVMKGFVLLGEIEEARDRAVDIAVEPEHYGRPLASGPDVGTP